MYLRVSIIGASGSIGNAVLRELSQRQIATRAVTRWSSSLRADVETEQATIDLEEPQSVFDSLAGSSVVVFCVSPYQADPLSYAQTKIGWLRRVLEASRDHQIDRFVLLSAADTATNAAGRVAEDNLHVPGDHFSFTDARYQCETEVMLRAADGMNASLVLPYLCAGPDTTARLSSMPDDPIFVSQIDDVARLVADECLGTEMGLRRVVVPGHLRTSDELNVSPLSTTGTGLMQRISGPKRKSRDDALIKIRPALENAFERE